MTVDLAERRTRREGSLHREGPLQRAGGRGRWVRRLRAKRGRLARFAALTLGLLGGLALLGPGAARADTVRLTDGTTLRGRAVRIGERLEVFGFSGVQTVPLSRVAAVETSPSTSAPRAAPWRTPGATLSTTPGAGADPTPAPVLDPRGLFQRAWALGRLGQPDDAATVRRRALSEELSERARALAANDEQGWARLELLAVLGGLDPGLVPALKLRARAVRDLAAAGAAPALRRTWPGPTPIRGPRARVVVIYPRASRVAEQRPVSRRRAQLVIFGGGSRLHSSSSSRSRSRHPGGITASAAYGQGRRTFGATRGGRTTFDAIRSQRRVTFGAARTHGKLTFRRARAAGGSASGGRHRR